MRNGFVSYLIIVFLLMAMSIHFLMIKIYNKDIETNIEIANYYKKLISSEKLIENNKLKNYIYYEDQNIKIQEELNKEKIDFNLINNSKSYQQKLNEKFIKLIKDILVKLKFNYINNITNDLENFFKDNQINNKPKEYITKLELINIFKKYKQYNNSKGKEFFSLFYFGLGERVEVYEFKNKKVRKYLSPIIIDKIKKIEELKINCHIFLLEEDNLELFKCYKEDYNRYIRINDIENNKESLIIIYDEKLEKVKRKSFE